MSAREVTTILWRRKLVMAFVVTLVIGATYLFLSRQQRVYEASATVALLPDTNSPNSPIAVSAYGELVETLIPTYAQLVKSETFLDEVASDLPFPSDGADLRGRVRVELVGSATGVLKLVARSPSPARAAAVARATASNFAAELFGNGLVRIQIIDRARPPTAAISPRPKLVLGAGLVVALGLAVAAAFGWDRLFFRVYRSAELTEAAGVRLLGVLPYHRALRRGTVLFVGDPKAGPVESALRALRTDLMFSMRHAGVRSVAITSLGPEEGKSTLVANLGASIAGLGFDVLVIDADLLRPKQHEIFGVGNERGLSSSIRKGLDLGTLVQPTAIPGLRLLTAGPPLADAVQASEVAMAQLPRALELADIVVVDTPPLRAAADVRLLTAAAGSVVLAVRAGGANPYHVRNAIRSLSIIDNVILGCVLVASREQGELGRGEYYAAGLPPDAREPAPR